MRLKEVKGSVEKKLSAILEGTGFILRKGEFTRKIRDGWQKIVPTYVDRSPEFYMELALFIRIDSEAVIFTKLCRIQPGFEKMISSIIILPTKMPWDVPMDLDVSTEEAIEAVVAFLKPIIENRILPLMDYNQSLESVEKLYNGPVKYNARNPNNELIHSVILARMVKNPQYAGILAKAMADSSAWHVKVAEEFTQIVNELNSMDL